MAAIGVARIRIHMWTRRIVFGLAGAIATTFAAIMLLALLLIASGVLEW